MKGLYSALFILTWTLGLACAQDAVRVLSSTKSGHTMLLNIGSLEGVKHKAIAKIFANVGTVKRPELINIGLGEVVKLEADKSYWFIKKPVNKVTFEKGSTVLLYLRDRIFDGLGNIKATKKKIIVPVGVKTKEVKKNLLKGMPEDLVMAEDGFEIGRTLLEKRPITDSDIIATDMQTWKTSGKKVYHEKHGKEYIVKRIQNLDRKREKENLEKAQEDYIFEEMVNGSTAKVNDLYYGIDELYQAQKRDKDYDEFKENIDIQNVYDKRTQKLKRESILTDATMRYIDIEGPLWSASMGDEQLRRFIHNSGVSREKLRRQASVTARLGHEFIIGLTSMTSNQTLEDDPNNRSTSYSLEIGYELHLERLSESLYNFGLEVFFHRGVSFYPVSDDTNGRFQLGAFSGALNFYIYNRPTTLNKMIWYVGAGISRAEAQMDSPELSKTYKFQLFSSPVFQTGLKYRFSNINDYYGETPIGLGISAKYSVSKTSVTVVDTIAEEDTLTGGDKFTDSKLSMAVNFYF